jgi:GNAT superfamily N-acetyltransferase
MSGSSADRVGCARLPDAATIRFAEPSDLKSISQFDLLPGDRVVEIIEQRMLVAEVGGALAGYLAWQHRGCISQDYINKLVVREGYRHAAVATRLLEAVPSVLHGRVFISAGRSNAGAQALLRRPEWTYAGEVTGLSPDGEAEVFFYRDL